MVGKKLTFTTEDLCERYGVTLRTIHHMERTQGYPLGAPFSKTLVWSVAKVLAWEKIHMPHLHVGSDDVDESPEQAAEWAELIRVRALEREAEKDKPPKVKKPPSRKK